MRWRLAERPKTLAVDLQLVAIRCQVIAGNARSHLERYFRDDKQEQRYNKCSETARSFLASGLAYKMQVHLSAFRDLCS